MPTKAELEERIMELEEEGAEYVRQMNEMMTEGKIKNIRIEELEKELTEQRESYASLLFESKLKSGEEQ